MEKMVTYLWLAAATIDTLVKAILKIINKQDHEIEIIGTRHGESCMMYFVPEKKCLLRKIKETILEFHQIIEI